MDFEGNSCPNCGTEISVKEAENPLVNATETDQLPQTPPSEIKGSPFWKNKSFIIPTAIAAILAISLISQSGTITNLKKEVVTLESQKNQVASDYKKVSSDFEKATDKYNTLKTEYDDYKVKMKPYEALDAAEAEARKIEADRIVAEKKAEEERVAAEKKAAEDKAAAEKKAAEEKAASATTEQKNALSQAKNYLGIMPFSHSGLIEQLKYEGYSDEAATYAADSCGADWNEQAAKQAQQYLDTMSFSHSGLVEQLIYEGFTADQAEYGVSAAGL